MNYDHAYHAGNFADVMKHIILIDLLNHLMQKPTPLCYLDTHAGRGMYDLRDHHAMKTKEAEGGILTLLNAQNPPALVSDYIKLIKSLSQAMPQKRHPLLRYYPGSPLIAEAILRPEDRLILCELQANTHDQLKQTCWHDKRIAVHRQDGYLGLKAFTPPKEKRGLVLIDPPFEDGQEFKLLSQALAQALKHWETGTYAIWYPIKTRSPIQAFYRSLQGTITRPMLAVEFMIHDEIPQQLNGCGMIVINPPWQFDRTLSTYLSWLWQSLSPNRAGGTEILTLSPSL